MIFPYEQKTIAWQSFLGLADVAVAIGQWPRVALGEEPMKVTLETRPNITVDDFVEQDYVFTVADNRAQLDADDEVADTSQQTD